MKLSKTEIFALLRSVLSAVGAYLLGVNLFGVKVDESLWQEVVGGAMAVAGIVFSVLDKSLSIEMISAFLRQTITVGGGLLVAAGRLKGQLLISMLALIPVIAPYIQAILLRKKIAGLQDGTINAFDLTKASK